MSGVITKKLYTISATALIVLFTLSFHAVHATTISPVRQELAGDPGSTVQSHIRVINESQTSEVLYTITLNFEPKNDESGEPNFIPTKDGLAAWTKTQDTITLGPKEQKDIPFSITIPKDAEPGGYFGALFTSTTPPKESSNGSIVLGERVGSLLLLRVNGNLADSGDILEFGAKNKSYFHTNLPVYFYFRFQNAGLDRVQPMGDIIVRNWFGNKVKVIAANPLGGNVLPKSIRRFEAFWQNSWGKTEQPDDISALTPPKGFWNNVVYEVKYFAVGPYTVQLNLVYGTGIYHTTTAKTKIFLFPWHILLILVTFFVIAYIAIRFLLTRYNRWIIRKAMIARKQNNTKRL